MWFQRSAKYVCVEASQMCTRAKMASNHGLKPIQSFPPWKNNLEIWGCRRQLAVSWLTWIITKSAPIFLFARFVDCSQKVKYIFLYNVWGSRFGFSMSLSFFYIWNIARVVSGLDSWRVRASVKLRLSFNLDSIDTKHARQNGSESRLETTCIVIFVKS